jgi:energy-coupling factor transport system ATP-binding protein
MQKQTCISLEEVCFRHNDDQNWTLRNINLTILQGEWISLIGQNGSGKSTLAKLLNGLYLPTEGSVLVNGNSTSSKDSIAEIRKQVGMVFQNPDHQFIGSTVEDDVAFGMENVGIPREIMLERVTESLTKVNMLEFKLVEPHRLSGGQKQRVAVAGVLAISPQIIVFDEATSMLDPKGRKELLSVLKQLHEDGITIISITHDVSEIIYSDRVIQLSDGIITFDGTPEQLFQSEQVNIDVPFTINIQKQLQCKGIPLRRHYLTHKELIEALWKLN